MTATPQDTPPEPVQVHLVCGGRFHDFDFARLELLKLLAERPELRVTVSGAYQDLKLIRDAAALITYTCDVRPSPEEQQALADWVAAGGRWFALHGTNAALEYTGKAFDAPRMIPVLARTLGSQFIAHPPIQPYTVVVSAPEDPLVAGISEFSTSDELYLSEYHGERRVLLETRFSGEAPGFVESDWTHQDSHAVMYLHPVDAGGVLYLTLGHCRGHYDMRPMMEYWPVVERGSWETDQYYTLLRRGIDWMVTQRTALADPS